MENTINSQCFSKTWLENKSTELSANLDLLEKTVHAFALLGYLVQLDLDFVFKGGTSLLLHLSNIKRLSIDIDIMFGGNFTEFTGKLSRIPGNTPFTRFEENERDHRGLPNRRHFKFFYDSAISETEESVLLDIVLDNYSGLPFIEKRQIQGSFFEITKTLEVSVPTIEGLLGDKLTAFAPSTIGVPFETSRGDSLKMQVVKQLFDIGELFNVATSFENVITAYNYNFEKENGYRESQFTFEQALEDTITISHLICLAKLKGYKSRVETDNIIEGLKSLSSHLLGEPFSIDSGAKIAATKAFLLAHSIRANKSISLEENRYSSAKIEAIKDVRLPSPYHFANRLKMILPEAFYYIWRGIEE